MNNYDYYKKLSKKFVLKILTDSNLTHKGLCDLHEIQNGNNEILLKHIRAICNILTKGYKEIIQEGDSNEY